MLRRNKNRKRSTRMPKQNRNTNGRKVRVEKLQDRQLMAADLSDFYGPIQPPSNTAPAEVANAGTTTNAAEGTNANFQLDPGKLTITGTDQRDVVKITGADDGQLKVTSITYDDAGNEIGSREQFYAANSIDDIVFFGNDGNDSFRNLTRKDAEGHGGEGNDYMTGQGANVFYGDGGNDRLYGGFRRDIMIGGSGNDSLFGSYGNDFLMGGDDNDYLYGGSGHDQMYGQSGNDYLRGDSGNDEMRAGSGTDRMYGKAGNDTMFGDSGVNTMYGGDDNDTMIGGRNRDIMYGEDGNDIMMGQEGRDYVHGGEGDDKLSGGSGSDTLSGSDGRDYLFGNGGLDYLFGGSDNDLLDGGDDGFTDSLHGNDGADIFVRHKHVWGFDDPDEFRTYSEAEADQVFNDYLSPNYGNDFPVPVR